MKKILLSTAIAAAMGTAGVANAAVDLDAATVLPLVFAQEINIPTGGLPLDVTEAGTNGGGNNATAAAVEVEFGFTIGQGTSKYVRLGFDQPLAAALTPTDFSDDASTATYSVSQGGAAGDLFVIVEVAAPTNGDDVLQDDAFLFQPGANKIQALNKNTQNISYALYETAVDAINQTNRLVGKSGPWISWGPGFTLTCTTPTPAPSQIDVVERLTFTSNLSPLDSNVAEINLAQENVYKADGTAVDLNTDYFPAASTAVISGSTAGFTGTGSIALATLTGAVAPAGTTTFTSVAGGTDFNGIFAVTANNATKMNASAYSLVITPEAGATYAVGPQPVDNCGSLQFSGSTDRLDFALTPGGVFQQMARITNPSGSDGAVTVTVYNDNGDEVEFPLGDIAGVDSILDAQASTKLININDIYAAAQAADSTFALAGTGADSKNKLRVEVRGEFGGNAFEDSFGANEALVERREDGIYIQGLTVSRDNNAFFQTK